MKEYEEIHDDEIRVIIDNNNDNDNRNRGNKWKWIVGVILLLVAVVLAIYIFTCQKKQVTEPEQALFEPEPCLTEEPVQLKPLGAAVAPSARGYTQLIDTVVNDIPLRLFIPHNATLELHVGKIDKSDSNIIYTAQAADVRADNGGIVGAFVLKGEPRAWGLSKKGYCASIDGKIMIGVADNSPLFEEATEKGGYFFRQYPLVKDGEIVENELKGKSIRRGICDRRGEIFMVESSTPESFHDFSQALVDLHVDQAVYLVGSSAYGWAIDEQDIRHEFGDENIYKSWKRRMPKNTSYVVWRRK